MGAHAARQYLWYTPKGRRASSPSSLVRRLNTAVCKQTTKHRDAKVAPRRSPLGIPLSETYAPWQIPIPGFPRVLSEVLFVFFRPKTTGEKRVHTTAYAFGSRKRSNVRIFTYAILRLQMLVECGGMRFVYHFHHSKQRKMTPRCHPERSG